MPPKKQPAAKPPAHELSPERAEALADALRPYDDRPGKFWDRNGDRVLDLLVRLLDRTTARDGG
jgi:hypothetical protein